MLKRWASWPLGLRWLLGVLAAVVLSIAAAWVLFVPAADWLAHHDVGSAKGSLLQTARDAARGRLLTLGAGLFAAGALIFTALNFNLLRRNSEQADQWQRRTYALTEQGQVTDRYTKAIEQLGSGKLDVQIGGIYALERVARDSARDHPTVMEVLTAFIREHSHEHGPSEVRPTRPNIQAAVTVVGRRDQDRDIQPIDLTGADLTGADLKGAHLNGAHLIRATLKGARLINADLTGADLLFATLIDADLTGAHLKGASFNGAHLKGATLAGAGLAGARLINADLTGAGLRGADLTGATLTDADLTDADLMRARWPAGMPVPEGWRLDNSGRLERAGTDSGPTEAS